MVSRWHLLLQTCAPLLAPLSSFRLISFMENKLVVGWGMVVIVEKKKRKENAKIASSFIFVRNFGNKKFGQFSRPRSVRWKKISPAIFHYPLVKNCERLATVTTLVATSIDRLIYFRILTSLKIFSQQRRLFVTLRWNEVRLTCLKWIKE